MKIKIALGQFNIFQGHLNENFDSALKMIDQAASLDCDILLLPELWSSGYDLEYHDLYTVKNDEINEILHQLSTDNDMSIGGSLIELCGDKAYNTFSLHIAGSLKPVKYHKIHLIPLLEEDTWLEKGNHPSIASSYWGKFGLSICYDLRFPELFRFYTFSGVELILLVAEWPLERIDHWLTLIQARAIENQVYIAAANGVGQSGKIMLGGRSCIIDPWGNYLALGKEDDEGLIVAEFDLDQVKKIRSEFPVLKHIQMDVFNQISGGKSLTD